MATADLSLLPEGFTAEKLAFDFDGVIADTAEAFLRLACHSHGYCNYTKEDITNFELENCIDIPGDLVVEIFTDILTDSIKTSLQPMPGAMSVLHSLASTRDVLIITARPLDQPVHDWFALHGSAELVQRVKVIATGDHDDKMRHLQEHGISFFIDDRAATCKELASHGVHPIVFTQPWNANRHSFPTVSSWRDIALLLGQGESDAMPPL